MTQPKSKSASKRDKKYKARARPARAATPRGATENGEIIRSMLAKANAKGSWKDHVVFVGSRMLDAWGTYQFARPDTGEVSRPLDEGEVVLVHKSKLQAIIGVKNAALFWHKGLSRRTSYGHPRSRVQTAPRRA